MQENLSENNPGTTVIHSKQANQRRQVIQLAKTVKGTKMESRNHHMKGRPTCQNGGPTGLVGRPFSPLRSLFALHRLVSVCKIYTVNFKALLSRFIQR